jgi:hypothetical protein
MARLDIVNPVAARVEHSVKPAARPRDLANLTVGLYWNMKAGGDVALDRAAERLRERFPGIRFRRYTGSVGFIMRHATADDADRMASEVQAVVGTSAD